MATIIVLSVEVVHLQYHQSLDNDHWNMKLQNEVNVSIAIKVIKNLNGQHGGVRPAKSIYATLVCPTRTVFTKLTTYMYANSKISILKISYLPYFVSLPLLSVSALTHCNSIPHLSRLFTNYFILLFHPVFLLYNNQKPERKKISTKIQ